MSKKILIILQSSLHVRNFVTTGVVNEISKINDVTLVAPQGEINAITLELPNNVKTVSLEKFSLSSKRLKNLATLRKASLIHRRSLNSTYKFKTKEMLCLSRNTKLLKALFPKLPETLFLIFKSYFVDIEKHYLKKEQQEELNKKALDFFEQENFEKVFVSSVIHEVADLELLKVAQKLKIPIDYFVASWDNLSSKGLFIVKPNKLMVWGDYDKKRAIKEHDFKEEEIVITGAPHFDSYFLATKKSQEEFLKERSIPSDAKILLFAGTTFSLSNNEPEILKALAQYLQQQYQEKVIIWYRPHPRTKRTDIVDQLSQLPNIFIDDQILKQANDKKFQKFSYTIQQGSLEHYKLMLESTQAVINFFSTMTIEASLKGKPSILLNFQLGENKKLKKGISRDILNCSHIKQITDWKCITIVESLTELFSETRKICDKNFQADSTLIQNAEKVAFNLDGEACKRLIYEITQN